MELKNIVLGIIFFSLCIAIGVGIMVGLASEYNVNYDEVAGLNQSLNQLNTMQTQINKMNSTLRSTDISPATAINSMATGAWTIMLIILNSGAIIDGMFRSIVGILGIPLWIASAIMTIVIFMIIMAIVAAIFWRQPKA